MRRKDEIAHLDALLRQTVYEDEVEIDKEFRVVDPDDVDEANDTLVESLDTGRHTLTDLDVHIQEAECGHDELLELDSPLVKRQVTAGIDLSSLHLVRDLNQLLLADRNSRLLAVWDGPEEVWQEPFVADKLEPGESESRVVLRRQRP